MRSISARCGPSFGASQITVASTLTTGAGEHPEDGPQQVDRVGVAPALVVGREVRAEVAEPGRAEQRVDHGVGDHVGVGVALEPSVVLDLDPAEDQPPPGGEAVAVVADPDAHQPSGSMPPLAALEDGDLLDAPVAQRLDRPLVLEPELLGHVRVGGQRERGAGVDAHLGERSRRVLLGRRACASPAVENSTAVPVSAIASTAGS